MANAHQTITFRAVENKEIIGLYQGPAKRAFNYARRANPGADIEIHEVHTLQCKVCGEKNPPDEFCWNAAQHSDLADEKESV